VSTTTLPTGSAKKRNNHRPTYNREPWMSR
jgi:hypothetical protein